MLTLNGLAQQYRIYIGTYTSEKGSAGIYTLSFDSASGTLGIPYLAARTRNPTFLAAHPKKPMLYASAEIEGLEGGQQVGGFKTFLCEDASGALTLLGSCSVAAHNAACHVAVSPDGRFAAGTNYGAAWVASMPVLPDGSLGSPASVITQEGEPGPRKSRQNKAYAHSAQFSIDGRFLFVCDLGLDTIFSYRVDPASGALTLASRAHSASGAGPRHSRPSADGRFLYVLNELSGSLDVFSIDGEGGLLLVEGHPLLSADFQGENTSAEVAIHPSGQFLYASNRGPDTISTFRIHPQTGRLSFIGQVLSGGRHPRHFSVSPDGHWLLCANRDTDSLNLFSIDPATGLPSPSGKSVSVPSAVCVLFCTAH